MAQVEGGGDPVQLLSWPPNLLRLPLDDLWCGQAPTSSIWSFISISFPTFPLFFSTRLCTHCVSIRRIPRLVTC